MANRVCIVTGASSGIGFETAMLLAKNGEKVYAAARRLDKMEPLKEFGVITVETDVTKEKELFALISRAFSENGRIDVLINNAGYGLYGAVEEVSMGAAKAQFEVNFFAAANAVRAVMPIMREQKEGLIINVTSIAGKIYTPMGSYYHASKHALEGLSDCLRVEAEQFGIRVVMIEPGLISTSWSGIMFDNLETDSARTVYYETAKGVEGMYRGFKYSHPSVIAKTILKAMNSKHPKARYRAGKYADLFVIAHALCPTKLYDKIMKLTVKNGYRNEERNR
ncbi:MAG: SDR family NAD(P)-dependent oxidoreductase [Clostridia bacterium]|nr:SDR family NAD(P)-dependent oxidoreductase [Clostridia bacterium]